MGRGSVFDDIVEEKLMNLHTGFVGKIISTNGETAKIQPLNMIKAFGEAAKKPAPITAPILKNARYKMETKELRYVTGIYDHSPQYATTTVAVPTPIKAGDIVFCMCADRDITESRRGQMSNAPCDRHSLSNSVVVGVFQ